MDDDLIIMNADVFFTEEILTALLKDKRSPVMAIDRSRVQEGDYFLRRHGMAELKSMERDFRLNCAAANM